MKGYGVKFSDGTSLQSASFLNSILLGSGATNQLALWSSSNILSGNASLVWDNLNFRLGLGITSPLYALHILANSSLSFDIAGGGILQVRGSNGTAASPTAILSGNTFARLSFQGFDGSMWDTLHPSGVAAIASENWNPTNHGTHLGFFSTATGVSGATTERMRLTASGFLGIGTSSPTTHLDVVGGAAFNQGNSPTADFIVGSLNTDSLLFLDASIDRVGINTSTPTATLQVEGSVKFNSGNSSAADFAVGSINTDYLLFVGASLDRVGINTPAPTATLQVEGSVKFNQGNSPSADFAVGSLNTDYLLFADASLDRVGINTASPIYSFQVEGSVAFNQNNSSTGSFRVGSVITDTLLLVDALNDRVGIGTAVTSYKLQVEGGTVAINMNNSSSADFRVGSSATDSLIFASSSQNKVGINIASPLATLHVGGSVALDDYSETVIGPDPTLTTSGKSYIKLTIILGSGSLTLSAGDTAGQILIIEVIAVGGTLTLPDSTSYGVILATSLALLVNSTIQLIFNGTYWVEVSRSIN